MDTIQKLRDQIIKAKESGNIELAGYISLKLISLMAEILRNRNKLK